ncbi:S-adenosylmethionine:tRNA ribosyltransferase-isomerase [Methanosarcinales archaeon]|uniref:tRNA preQ1(34) S-adenosylmethionine ribosyltransferase-isomerase QueA n=1 Tax=Candidatus Methanoperedens sp. BLZ2 TaxID=2035255 RepID=UPI000BE369FB|nr:tRNA preQ1(34) S-adenosylmethionine ribosyltransferase-isomerase QueA [Candidatus Methanoperedens sp. BLZ2]KAB2947293.1 MAG: tRNA preQ1(34) S-adenosylmethionine ribosyltransferase-isomerase QueA [Candidatus Methanoperedens sp.]MBZ0175440.1 tRNA preQ1(34) S-adenosylmethionine ribosyltransferase-isomerase QueA [Candidatus Methanoperedens nitroreducens]MCX9079704.1 tRNA preQ1(34) S-adenosylmethionine ribosyltransferase-isomerase QueA [Candidatus Methanoperedens sp.]CAG0970537.1 S-adenosylmethio
MKLSEFDYHLPKELIAQSPIEPRDASKLMVVGQQIENRFFCDVLDYFEAGDTLVLNDSRVIPAKLMGKKSTGGHVEALVVSRNDAGYECMIRGKNIREGTKINFGELEATVLRILEKPNTNRYLVNFNCNGNLPDILEKIGEAPLPPYIKQKLDDKNRYQTVYSKEKGSIAAPTAGLHFTNELLERIKEKGVNIAYVTLHVSPGTFTPVQAQDIENHIMEPEYISVRRENADIINGTTGKLIAAGTTTVKALESSCIDGKIIEKEGFSELFIYPSYQFRSKIDAMITNFHLPKSTLLMLVSAFAGRERLMEAYNKAISHSYRFYSFGDAMLVFREGNK